MSRDLLLRIALAAATITHAWADDKITLDQPRSLAYFAKQLIDRYGFLVTYEEAPFDPSRDIEMETRNGKPYQGSRHKPMTFQVNPTAPARETVERLVAEYNRSGNPGQFRVLADGETLHIIPAGRMVDGKLDGDWTPVLSTIVTVPAQSRQCYLVVNQLYSELGNAGAGSVVNGIIDMNMLLGRICTIEGGTLPARQILSQIVTPGGKRNSVTLEPNQLGIVWTLMYEPNTNRYFLSTRGVHDGTSSSPAVVTPPPTEPKKETYTGLKPSGPVKDTRTKDPAKQ